MADEVAEYRRLLLKHGVPVKIPSKGSVVDDLLERAVKARSKGASWALEHGRFTDGRRDIVVLPPDPDLIRSVRKALTTAAGDDVRLRSVAAELILLIDEATKPAGRPCGDSAEVSREEVDAARARLGAPSKKRRPLPSDPLVVSYGLGVDSTALLVGLAALYREGRHEFRPEVILFADTGGEKDETYAYMRVMNQWLDSVGFPRVQVVGWFTEHTAKGYGSARTLEQQCLINQTMPSISASKFGASLCSVLWKQGTMNRWMELQSGLLEQQRGKGWSTKSGGKIVKAIGYDASETKRAEKGTFRVDQELRDLKDKGRLPIYEYWYPLQDWGWDRARCIAEIENAIGKAPPKSSCWFCGAMKKPEIAALPKDQLMRALLIEAVGANGRHGSKQDFGLGGTFRWVDYATETGLVTKADLSKLERQVETVLAAAPDKKGALDEGGAQDRMSRLPAFSDVRGFRGKRLPMWDRYDVVTEEDE